MEKQTIGEFLATLRRANGFKQQEVADRLGISNRTLSAWERGTALPDILLLPALAELYGVTTDEILSGERRQGEASKAEFSHKNETKLLKSKLAKFTMQAVILTGTFCLGLFLLFIGWDIHLTTVVWAEWRWWLLLLFLGLAIAIVSEVVLIAFCFGAEGSADDESESFGAYSILLKKRFFHCSTVGAGLSFLFAVIGFFVLFHENGGILVLFFFALSLALFFSGLECYHRALKKWGGAEIRGQFKQNNKIFRKVALFGLIPVGFAIALIMVFSYWQPESRGTQYEAPTREEFIREMESFEVSGVYYGWDGAPDDADIPNVGTYYFPLSALAETAETYEEIDLGNGFTCRFTDDKYTCYIRSLYEIQNEYSNGYDFEFVRVATADGSFSVYKVKYADLPVSYTNVTSSMRWELEIRGEGAALVHIIAENYSEFAYLWGSAIIATDAVVCIIICYKKRQKSDIKL